MAVEYNLPGELGVTPAGSAGGTVSGAEFRAAFNTWAQIVLYVSGLLALSWYAIGEWGPRSYNTRPGTWLLIWLAMLAVVVAVSLLALFLGPQTSENGFVLALFYIGSGTLFFYIAAVFRSPTATKYLIWPARHARR